MKRVILMGIILGAVHACGMSPAYADTLHCLKPVAHHKAHQLAIPVSTPVDLPRPVLVPASPDPEEIDVPVLRYYLIIQQAPPAPAHWWSDWTSDIGPREGFSVAGSTAAPELDPGAGLTTVVFLAGALTIMRGRRQ